MKRHKMTMDITLEVTDGVKLADARKRVQEYLSACTYTSGVSLTRFSGARPWEKKERRNADICCEITTLPG